MEEIVAIVSIFVILPSIIVGAVTKVKAAKYEAQARSGSGDGLRASELRRLIHDAVEEVVEPLHDRIDDLEARLGGGDVAAPRLDPAVLADALDDPEADVDDPAVARRRTRS